MNYYIQGDAAKADKIKAAFEKLGVSDLSGYNFGNGHALFYTYDCGGSKVIAIVCVSLHVADIIKTHPDYKELELPIEFKNGDIIGFNDCTHNDGSYVDWVGIYKRKRDDSLNQNQHLFHCVVASMGTFRTGGSWIVFTAYPATKEQRDLLFSKMKEAGYEWDEKKKELRKIKPHYDIANFQPFDKVLVRDTENEKWVASLFSNFEYGAFPHKFVCIDTCYTQCIPFEGNEHLLGTTDMCDEMYINW